MALRIALRLYHRSLGLTWPKFSVFDVCGEESGNDLSPGLFAYKLPFRTAESLPAFRTQISQSVDCTSDEHCISTLPTNWALSGCSRGLEGPTVPCSVLGLARCVLYKVALATSVHQGHSCDHRRFLCDEEELQSGKNAAIIWVSRVKRSLNFLHPMKRSLSDSLPTGVDDAHSGEGN